MLKNEKGFIYPLTFTFVLLAASLLAIRIEFYLTESKFLKEEETIWKQEYYFLSSVKKTEKILQHKADQLPTGHYLFSDGTVQYTTSKVSDTVYMTTFILIIKNRSAIKGYGYFSTTEGKMVKWIERN